MSKTAAIIGAGPAGLMAAEILSQNGFAVTVYERKPTCARKFLMAGHGGLNITHSEDLQKFMSRYGRAATHLERAIATFTPADLQNWCAALGEDTFVGTSGRVFPKSFKASPLLRAWLYRLQEGGVRIVYRAQWQGWDNAGALVFQTDKEQLRVKADVTILALGGASWPRLGADGSWVSILAGRGVNVAPLVPANCGFTVNWTDVFRAQYAGSPVKPVALTCKGHGVRGEMMITQKGIEGGGVYALSSVLRDAISQNGHAVLNADLMPDVAFDALLQRLQKPRGALSFSNYLRKAGLSAVAAALVREVGGKNVSNLPVQDLAQLVKNLPLQLDATSGIDRAISSAGGVVWDELDETFMLKKIPNVYCVGEMLDWEAPTGGYLLQATFSTAALCAKSIARVL